ncbi:MULTISPECIES: hypothetical protein [Variovorax]|jgi:hypothetical protein|uniref:hypothetical protein n=1 Tax=Variovorax TaxID=34072 RepID=UPI00092A6D9C|nr:MULTISPECIES: hypothetical protein [Variovorax]MBN8758748.1 hypothetical protein [Variovorax sp.]OJZ04452.1 MAG: hypothetical protein BGP22_06285 [Variovorax sp. 67-131]UKI07713.1 hypothetical protein L3V85_33810 [Variovorax paradoxus]
MPSHYRLADITVRIPFGATEPERTALLQAAGVPVDASGGPARGFMHERRPLRLGGDSICRWFDAGNAALASGLHSVNAGDRASAGRSLR